MTQKILKHFCIKYIYTLYVYNMFTKFTVETNVILHSLGCYQA